MPERNHNRQLIVSGFHRSGTSLTMQALNNAGLYLGNNLMPSHPSNPDGHFENRAIVSLHDKLLATQNRRWYTPGGPLSSFDQTFCLTAQSLIEDYMGASSAWGFKDPRTCFFLDWWQALLPRAGAVLVFRHYLPCYHSLRNREAQILTFDPQSSLHFWQNPLLGLQLWLDYNNALLNFAKRTPDTTMLVSCEAMLSGFDLVTAVNDRFGLSLDAQSPTGIRNQSSTLKKHHCVLSAVPADLLNRLNTTLQELDDLAITTADSHPIPSLATSFPPEQEITQTHELLDALGVSPIPTECPTEKTTASATNKADDEIDYALKKIEHANANHSIAEASKIVEQCLSSVPDNIRLHIAAGRFFLNHTVYEKAEEQFRFAYLLNPGDPVSLLNLGFLANNQQQFLKASHYLEMAIALQPGNAILYFHQSTALQRAGKQQSALQACENGLALDPSNIKLNGLKIRLLIESANLTTARNFCTELVNQYPDECSYHSSLSELESSAGHTQAAAYHFYLSTWKKIVRKPHYRQQLLDAIGSLRDARESQALQSQVNRELQTLIQHIPVYDSVATRHYKEA